MEMGKNAFLSTDTYFNISPLSFINSLMLRLLAVKR